MRTYEQITTEIQLLKRQRFELQQESRGAKTTLQECLARDP